MNGWEIAGWVALGLLPFWALGAYNRLVGLRASLLATWQAVAEHARRREPLLSALMRRLREPLSASHDELDAVVAALAQVQDSLAGARPTQRGGIGTFAQHERDLRVAWRRVRERIEAHPVPEGAPTLAQTLAKPLAEVQAEWERMAEACERFNAAAVVHDGAIAQWPTRILVPLFGFTPAGRL